MNRGRPARLSRHGLLAVGLLGLALTLGPEVAEAEYGDVVLNKRSQAAGVRPVVFPHWFHRIRYRCTVCHGEFGFVMRAGGNDVQMSDIVEGKFCGMCHNGQVAWGAEQCDLCHSGKPGTKTGIYGGHQTGGPGKW